MLSGMKAFGAGGMKKVGMGVAALALVGAAVPLMGAGPWDAWSRYDRGRERDRDRDRNDHTRGGLVVRIGTPPPPVVVVTPCEESPLSVKLTAYQAGDTIMVFVEGTNRSGGYTTTLALDGCTFDGRPRLVLHNVGPGYGQCVTQACTPFTMNASVRTYTEVKCLSVRVGGGAGSVVEVPVVCVPRLS